jgi:hypothetical protein
MAGAEGKRLRDLAAGIGPPLRFSERGSARPCRTSFRRLHVSGRPARGIFIVRSKKNDIFEKPSPGARSLLDRVPAEAGARRDSRPCPANEPDRSRLRRLRRLRRVKKPHEVSWDSRRARDAQATRHPDFERFPFRPSGEGRISFRPLERSRPLAGFQRLQAGKRRRSSRAS